MPPRVSVFVSLLPQAETLVGVMSDRALDALISSKVWRVGMLFGGCRVWGDLDPARLSCLACTLNLSFVDSVAGQVQHVEQLVSSQSLG